MRTTLTLAALVLSALACGTGKPLHIDQQQAQEDDLATHQSSLATLENGLPYDGCTWVVDIGEKQFTPSDAAIARVETFTKKAIGKTTATIEYRATGAQKTVQCGWGSKEERPEIEIFSIK